MRGPDPRPKSNKGRKKGRGLAIILPVSTSPNTPSVSVVIVSWNRRDLLRGALESIAANGPWPRQVIVVDNGSTDGTAEMLRGGEWPGPLTLYRAPRNLNASEGRNVGIRLATGELVMFMDSDAELVEEGTVPRLAGRFAAEPGLGAVAPFIYRDRERREPWFLNGTVLRGWYCDSAGILEASEGAPAFLTSCCVVYRREALERVGGFDLGLPYGHEDHDLSLRVKGLGLELAMAPEVAVQHHFTPVARILGESDRWRHHAVDERARGRIQLRRHGLLGYLREEAWQWTRAGREQRRNIYYHSGLPRWRRLALFTMYPALTVLTAPWVLFKTRRSAWLDETRMDPARREVIGGGG